MMVLGAALGLAALGGGGLLYRELRRRSIDLWLASYLKQVRRRRL